MCMYMKCGGCCYKTRRNGGGGESKKDSIRESVDAGGERVGQVAEGHARDRWKVRRLGGMAVWQVEGGGGT